MAQLAQLIQNNSRRVGCSIDAVCSCWSDTARPAFIVPPGSKHVRAKPARANSSRSFQRVRAHVTVLVWIPVVPTLKALSNCGNAVKLDATMTESTISSPIRESSMKAGSKTSGKKHSTCLQTPVSLQMPSKASSLPLGVLSEGACPSG